jgi:hypothetical protein
MAVGGLWGHQTHHPSEEIAPIRRFRLCRPKENAAPLINKEGAARRRLEVKSVGAYLFPKMAVPTRTMVLPA